MAAFNRESPGGRGGSIGTIWSNMAAASTLHDFIVSHLRSAQWRAGDRLPTERALSEQFGLSRGTVRKVLQALRAQGVLEATVGSGTYVTPQAQALLQPPPGDDPLRQTSPAELMEARLALEPAIIEMVVAHATAADFERMDECCAQAEAATTLEAFEYWDGLLHEVIAGAARNSFVASVFRLMNEVRSHAEWGALKRRSVTPERRLLYQAEHRALVQAIRERDTVQARAVSTEHLLRVRRNMLNF